MSYKTILAILQGKEDAARVLECAVPLAVQHEAHLIGLHAEALPIPHATPMGIPDTGFIEAGTELARERAAEIEAIFTRHCGSGGLSGEWRAMESYSGDSATSGLESARCADLVVAQQRDPDTPGIVADLEALLFHSGRPALFVPYAIKVGPPFKRVTLAWNGSPEAARAAFDALPLIKAANETTILVVDAESNVSQDDVFSGTAIASALSRHGAQVTIQNQHSGDVSAADIIQNHVSDNGADLLVTGAYSQSRLKEFFFGGVTRALLQSMTCATFMSR
jgi:nucleotide-binding universal stress UspA family protein